MGVIVGGNGRNWEHERVVLMSEEKGRVSKEVQIIEGNQ